MVEIEHTETFLTREITNWFKDNDIDYEVNVEPYKYLPPGCNVGYTQHKVRLVLRFFSKADATLFKLTWYGIEDA